MWLFWRSLVGHDAHGFIGGGHGSACVMTHAALHQSNWLAKSQCFTQFIMLCYIKLYYYWTMIGYRSCDSLFGLNVIVRCQHKDTCLEKDNRNVNRIFMWNCVSSLLLLAVNVTKSDWIQPFYFLGPCHVLMLMKCIFILHAGGKPSVAQCTGFRVFTHCCSVLAFSLLCINSPLIRNPAKAIWLLFWKSLSEIKPF